MADLRESILRGTVEAERVHKQFSIQQRWSEQKNRIDVFGTIDDCNVALAFQPLGGLLGAYLPEPSPGVIISTQRPLSVRRFTAAHELGHFVMGHKPSLDDEKLLKRDPFADRYDAQEVEADAFAIAFLMPTWALAGHMRHRGWTRQSFVDPATVYQLSLRVGLSFEATCYALQKYKVISPVTCVELLRRPRREIKVSLVGKYKPENWYRDVWDLTSSDNSVFVEASAGDLIRITLPEHASGGYRWDIDGFSNSDVTVVADERINEQGSDCPGALVQRQLLAIVERPGAGSVRLVEQRPWMRMRSDPLNSFTLLYSFSAANERGFYSSLKRRMLEVT